MFFSSECNALIQACCNRMTDVALRLIETGDLKLDQVDTDGSTALTLACCCGIKVDPDRLFKAGSGRYIWNDCFNPSMW